MNNEARQINNVVGFKLSTPKSNIDTFINSYDSENTRITYMRNYKVMFMHLCGKEIEELTWENINSIDVEQVKKFRDYLKTKYSYNSINSIIFSCKALWDDLIENKKVTINPFDIKKLKIRNKTHYGSLTTEEIKSLFDYCLSLKDRGLTKKLYFEFLYTVTCRKHVAQNLTWNDIIRTLNKQTGTMYWVVNTYDKTENVDRAISDEFYNQIKDNFNSYSDKDKAKGKIFNVENQTLELTLKNFCKEHGIDKEARNIVQHSIKSSGLDRIQSVFEDVTITARAGGHKQIQTTYDNYVGKNVDYSQQPSVLLNKNYSIDILNELDKDSLIELIKKCGKNTIDKMCVTLENESK